MRLFLDSSTRVVRGVAPAGATTLPDISGTVEIQISDDAWQSTYLPAWRVAFQGGQDLAIATDGSTSAVAHVATPREQAVSVLSAYLANSTPTGADTVQALKALIRVVRSLV